MMIESPEGSMLMEYVIVAAIVLLGGSLAVGDAGTTLLEMAGVSVTEENNFGLFGNYAVDWFRRLMWMVAQPFP
ncbi:MAG: hypothetical protein IJT50_02470 [Lentisphaeria bacterium]|nr:hypothetical protein [Lentisphaeria bacterium]